VSDQRTGREVRVTCTVSERHSHRYIRIRCIGAVVDGGDVALISVLYVSEPEAGYINIDVIWSWSFGFQWL